MSRGPRHDSRFLACIVCFPLMYYSCHNNLWIIVLRSSFIIKYNYNDPKPLSKDHHCFGVFSKKLFLSCGISSNSLLIHLFRCVYMCVCSK
jgi:hypothetical protein